MISSSVSVSARVRNASATKATRSAGRFLLFLPVLGGFYEPIIAGIGRYAARRSSSSLPNSRVSRHSSAQSRPSASAEAERPPCFQLASAAAPPCILQRVYSPSGSRMPGA